MSKFSKLITTADLNAASKSFGIVGSSAFNGNKIIVLTSNDNEPVFTKEMVLNKPLVKMINALASIDGFLKQRIDNQKIIARNAQLSSREDIIEGRNAQPQIEEIKPDAEKVGGGATGLLALGGLALLTLDPVQQALKSVIDGVITAGTFITQMVTSVNSAFDFLFGQDANSVATPETSTLPRTSNSNANPQDAEAQPTTSAVPQTQTESTVTGIASSAITGATIGSFVSRIGGARGAAIGAGLYVANRVFNSGETTSPTATTTSMTSTSTASSTTSRASSTTPPVSSSASTSSRATSSAATSTTSTTPATSSGGIPRNDTNDRSAITRLGRYLNSQGVRVSEHPDFDSSIGGHSPNSRHYRGLAIDLNISGPQEAARFDALEPQLRAAGYNTIWRKADHQTHMHVSVGGSEGGGAGAPGAGGLASAISSVATVSLETAAKLFGALGSAIIEPGIPRTDVPGTIAAAARELNSEIAVNRNPEPPSPPPPPAPPRINRSNSGPTQNPPTTADRNSVYYYLRRSGYQNLSTPESTLRPAA